MPVKETLLYELLDIEPTATELEIKKAYRKQAIKLHPDKNPDDPTAHAKFQEVGEAYQILSSPELRKAYDEHGMEGAKPDSGFQDPSEMFNTIFGGEAFSDWVGEISMLRDMEKSMEISMRHDEENARDSAAPTPPLRPTDATPTISHDSSAATAAAAAYPTTDTATDLATGADAKPPLAAHNLSNPEPDLPPAAARPKRLPVRLAIGDASSAAAVAAAEEAARDTAAGVTDEEKQLRSKEKKKGVLTKEQREELAAFELERKRVRDERVESLSAKLMDRISIWTETEKDAVATTAFQAKMLLEAESLKMESFGLEMLHAIGATYAQKSSTFIKSHRPIIGGLTGFFSRLKDKGTMLRDGLGTVSTAISAQMELADMAKMEEAGGDEWTAEKKDEYERRVTGKILAAAWRGSKFEIQGVLRDVCDKVLNDKSVKTEKRLERAQALQLIADVFVPAQRSPEEDSEQFVFEMLVRDAAEKKKQDPAAASHGHHHKRDKKSKAAAAAATAEEEKAASAATTSATDGPTLATDKAAEAGEKVHV